MKLRAINAASQPAGSRFHGRMFCYGACANGSSRLFQDQNTHPSPRLSSHEERVTNSLWEGGAAELMP